MNFQLLFLLITINGCFAGAIQNIIANYLIENKITLTYFFTCWTKNEISYFNSLVNYHGIRTSFTLTQQKIRNAIQDKNITLYASVLEFSCNNNSASKSVNFRMYRPWLIIGNTSNNTHWDRLFKNISIRLDSNVNLIVTEDNNNYIMFNIYNLGRNIGGSTIFNGIGHGNESHFFYKKSLAFYNGRKNMTGITLRATSVTVIGCSVNTGINLTITDKWYGNTTAGVDGGVANDLHEDRADICCTGGAQRYSRVDVLDYVMPSYHFRPCYIFRNPGSYDPLTNEFLAPFSTNSWLVTLFASILISILLKYFYSIENNIFQSRKRYAWSTVILITMATIFQQGSSSYPTRFVGRLTFFILLIMSVLIYNYYTSSILSSLLSNPPSVIDSLEELGHSGLDIGIENLPYTITWFIITNTNDVQYIYKKKVTLAGGDLNILTPEEGIAKVGRGGFAYYTQLDTGYPIIAKTFDQDAICDLAKLPMVPQTFGGLIVQKKSQYLELFQITLNLVRQSGLIQRLSMIWESKTPACLSNSRVIPVGIDQTFIAFLTLIIGGALAICILLIEIVLFKISKRNRFTRKCKFFNH